MPRIAYVNGRYLPHRDAAVHIEDRGYQFADAVYVLHCFQKKTEKTSKTDLDVAAKRYRDLLKELGQ